MTYLISLKRLMLRLAWPVATLYWFVRRPHVEAAACVVRRGDKVLLVRHTYGRREEWSHPGGLIGRGETPAIAAAREVCEETGLIVAPPQHLWTQRLRRQSRYLTLHMFAAEVASGALALDPVEIAAAKWFTADKPPQPLREFAAEAIIKSNISCLGG